MRLQATLLALLCTLSSTAWSQTNPPAPADTTRMPTDTMQPAASRPEPAPRFNRDSASAAQKAALDAARRAWSERGPSSYAYTLTIICFCNYRGDYAVEVRRGRITSVGLPRLLPMTTEPGTAARLAYILTVPQLFDRARREARADRLGPATYHPELGYPTEMILGDGMNMGTPDNPNFIGYRISDLRPL
ncbi:MAG TPA: DUF6174 domain-containing protein [Longimicrobium sp.]